MEPLEKPHADPKLNEYKSIQNALARSDAKFRQSDPSFFEYLEKSNPTLYNDLRQEANECQAIIVTRGLREKLDKYLGTYEAVREIHRYFGHSLDVIINTDDNKTFLSADIYPIDGKLGFKIERNTRGGWLLETGSATFPYDSLKDLANDVSLAKKAIVLSIPLDSFVLSPSGHALMIELKGKNGFKRVAALLGDIKASSPQVFLDQVIRHGPHTIDETNSSDSSAVADPAEQKIYGGATVDDSGGGSQRRVTSAKTRESNRKVLEKSYKQKMDDFVKALKAAKEGTYFTKIPTSNDDKYEITIGSLNPTEREVSRIQHFIGPDGAIKIEKPEDYELKKGDTKYNWEKASDTWVESGKTGAINRLRIVSGTKFTVEKKEKTVAAKAPDELTPEEKSQLENIQNIVAHINDIGRNVVVASADSKSKILDTVITKANDLLARAEESKKADITNIITDAVNAKTTLAEDTRPSATSPWGGTA